MRKPDTLLRGNRLAREPGQHTRNYPRSTGLRLYKEMRALYEKGVTKSEIRRATGLSRNTIDRMLAHPRQDELTAWATRDEVRVLAPVPELTPEPPESPAPSESDSVEFLREARDNPDLAWADRIKCALAVAKLESGDDGKGWTAPSDQTLWASALVDAFAAQVPEVQSKVGELLRGRGSETP